jgi:hypothetical protein
MPFVHCAPGVVMLRLVVSGLHLMQAMIVTLVHEISWASRVGRA